MPEIELEEDEFTGQLTGDVLKRIAQLLRPYWKWALSFVLAIGTVSALDGLLTIINKNIIDRSVVGGDSSALARLAGMYIGLMLIQSLGVFIFIYMASVLGERLDYDLRKKMFKHLQDLSLSYYSQNSVGRLMSRVTSDSERVSNVLTWGLIDITWSTIN